MGIGATSETFSNIKTPQVVRKARATTQNSITKTFAKTSSGAAATARAAYRPRHLAHLGLLAGAILLVYGNNPAQAHNISVKMAATQVGAGTTLDAATTANISADLAAKSHFLVTTEATKTASVKNEQVALQTSDESTLSKRQVVATAGNATRDIATYAVQPGDTLSGIASKFNVTSSTIKWANNLSDADSITPGQTLTILPVTGVLHTVAAGETADSLASKFSANAAQIVSFNNAEVKGLVLGQQIIIPDGVIADAPKPAPVVTAPASRTARSGASIPRITYFAGAGNSYAYGYCTYYVASRRSVPPFWGNASSWYYNAQASGFGVGSTPVRGAIAWTGAGYYGHVAYVESVSGNMVTVSEMNYNGGWNRVSYRTVPASSFRYIY